MYELLEKVERLREAPAAVERAMAGSLFVEAARLVTEAQSEACSEALRDVAALDELRRQLLDFKRRLFALLVAALRRFLFAEPGDAVADALVRHTIAAHRAAPLDASTAALINHHHHHRDINNDNNDANDNSNDNSRTGRRDNDDDNNNNNNNADAHRNNNANDNDGDPAELRAAALADLLAPLPTADVARDESTFLTIVATSLALLDGVHSVWPCFALAIVVAMSNAHCRQWCVGG
jgi:hypothetical protein